MCEASVDGRKFEDVSEFKCIGFVSNESDTHDAECCDKVAIRMSGFPHFSVQGVVWRHVSPCCNVWEVNNTMKGEEKDKRQQSLLNNVLIKKKEKKKDITDILVRMERYTLL